MQLLSVRAAGFRNLANEIVTFSPGVNLLYGSNAEGKTNLLEAVYYFARGKSFRGAQDKELLGFGAPFYEIEAKFLGGGRERSLLYRYTGRERVRKINGVRAETAAEMIGVFQAVLFHPEHLMLVKGAPQLRRDFINIAIAGLRPEYLNIYASYQKILENRNTLLRFAQKGLPFEEEEFRVWTQKLAEAAARIVSMRYEYMRMLSPIAAEIIADISGGRESLSLSYRAEVEENIVPILSEKYATLMMSDIRREIAAGYTVFGPHHDDIEILLGSVPARLYASQGQQRSIALAMKLAEGEVSHRMLGEYPVFLFDDVMSELDAGRRQYLLSALSGRQILVTACDERDFSRTDAHLIKVSGGKYEAVSE